MTSAWTMRRMTSDGTRCVVGDDAKFAGSVLLNLELDQLCEFVRDLQR